jgi:hypothetical protein
MTRIRIDVDEASLAAALLVAKKHTVTALREGAGRHRRARALARLAEIGGSDAFDELLDGAADRQ